MRFPCWLLLGEITSAGPDRITLPVVRSGELALSDAAKHTFQCDGVFLLGATRLQDRQARDAAQELRPARPVRHRVTGPPSRYRKSPSLLAGSVYDISDRVVRKGRRISWPIHRARGAGSFCRPREARFF